MGMRAVIAWQNSNDHLGSLVTIQWASKTKNVVEGYLRKGGSLPRLCQLLEKLEKVQHISHLEFRPANQAKKYPGESIVLDTVHGWSLVVHGVERYGKISERERQDIDRKRLNIPLDLLEITARTHPFMDDGTGLVIFKDKVVPVKSSR